MMLTALIFVFAACEKDGPVFCYTCQVKEKIEVYYPWEGPVFIYEGTQVIGSKTKVISTFTKCDVDENTISSIMSSYYKVEKIDRYPQPTLKKTTSCECEKYQKQ